MTNILDIPTEYKILVEKEYYELDPKKPTIGLLMMVKNESKRLHVSLKSVIGSVDAIIIFDTGSTDNTIDIIKNFSEKNKINLYLIQGDFVNFSISVGVYCEVNGAAHTLFICELLACNIKCSAVIWTRPDYWQTSREVYTIFKTECFECSKTLVVVHR